jgi:pimeloyl-ACP methyl ester carboxylesterase
MVLLVHGGPWARDFWGFNAAAQWLANRGYAVLQVNYRGSSGYGKTFLHKGDKQWGIGDMQHDLSDAVAWAVKSGVALEDKVCIYGGSYGGYACLAGLAFTPDLYCCGVDIVGPSNVKTLLDSIPPYWCALPPLDSASRTPWLDSTPSRRAAAPNASPPLPPHLPGARCVTTCSSRSVTSTLTPPSTRPSRRSTTLDPSKPLS